jgi:nitroreductase
MEFRDILKRRRMVHAFEQRAVPPEVVRRVMETVLRAPSAGYTQGNEFLVLDRPEATGRFWEITTDPRWPREPEEIAAAPPVLVLPLSNEAAYLARYSQPDKAEFGLQTAKTWPVPYWDLDAAMAVMLILLAAIDEGLGGWFFGLTYGVETLLQELGIPAGFKPIGAVGLGYPAPQPGRAGSSATRGRRPFEDVVHVGTW